MKTKKITLFQLFMLVVQTQVGVGILSLPYLLFLGAGKDGWISLLIGGMVIQFVLLLYYFLLKKYPEKSLYEVFLLLFGNKAGKLFVLLYAAYFVAIGILIVVQFERIISRWVLPETPSWVIGLILVFLAAYLAKESLVIISRYDVLVSPFLLIIIVFIAFSLKDANLMFIMPIGQEGIMNMILTSKDAMIALLGFEIFFFGAGLAEGTPKKKLRSGVIGVLFVTLLYLYVTFVCYIYFSPQELPLVPEPVLYLLKSFTFRVIERTDLLFLSLWVVFIHNTLVIYLYLSSTGITHLRKKKKSHSKYIFLPSICLFIGSLFVGMKDNEVTAFSKYLSYGSYAFVFFIPIAVILISLFMKKKDGDQVASKNT
ncbi:GerAB/ArcD/ProY family transporter [Metabacillus sp. RGM 3146]|uniref:GerAB/ArcD/ProY family transporter n=1 Tax=Metabacillus sp. RGM 3146 TaxID=3401092 RepID=UPI003B99D60F